jgi:hypothetical protein
MSRKHFAALAAAFKQNRPVSGSPAFGVWASTVRAVADVCNVSNTGFDYERFYIACGGVV